MVFRFFALLKRSGYGAQEIYFRVPSKTTPTTILVAVIKAHRNRKTNLNTKTKPNPDLQKTCKKKLKEKRKKIITRTAGFEPVTLDSVSTNPNPNPTVDEEKERK